MQSPPGEIIKNEKIQNNFAWGTDSISPTKVIQKILLGWIQNFKNYYQA